MISDPQSFRRNSNLNIEPLSEACLECICESISSCDRSQMCTGDVCGMFRITRKYWIDSGKPVLEGDDPNDKQCKKKKEKSYKLLLTNKY